MHNVKWIFFDIGDTLVDESVPFGESIRQFVLASSSLGYSFREDQVRSELFRSYRELHEQPMGEVMARLVRSQDDLKTIKSHMKYPKEKEAPFQEAESVIRYLSSGYQLGVIANQSIGTSARLEKYSLRPYFKVICASAETGFSKPDPRIFEQALQEAGCTADAAAMVGDRVDNDIIPAKRLGMKAVWIRQGFARQQPIPAEPLAPDAVIDRLEELKRLF